MTRRITGPEVLTRGEVAQVLEVHPSTVARWAAAGLLPCFRTPAGERRYRRSEVQDFLNQPLSAPRAA
jgi:excisionase family DNA binding protein